MTIVMVLLAGCQTGQPVPLEDLSPALASVQCARTFECFAADERADLIGAEVADEQACVTHLTRVFFDALQPAFEAVDDGVLRYNGDAVTECLSTLDRASCADLRIGLDYATRTCESAFECIGHSCDDL